MGENSQLVRKPPVCSAPAAVPVSHTGTNSESKAKSKGVLYGIAFGGARQRLLGLQGLSSTARQEENLYADLDNYMAEPTIATPPDEEPDHFDVLKWWSANGARFPRLARMAKHFVCVPLGD